MAMVGSDSKIEMPGIGREPVGDFLRPFDRQTPRRYHKIVQQQIVDLPRVLQAIRVKVQQIRRPPVECENIKRGAGDRADHTKPVSEALYERGLSDAEIAVQRERGVGGQRGREGGGERPRLVSRVRDDPRPQPSADARSHDSRPN